MGSNIPHNGVNIRPKIKGLNRELEDTIKRRTKVSSTITNFKNSSKSSFCTNYHSFHSNGHGIQLSYVCQRTCFMRFIDFITKQHDTNYFLALVSLVKGFHQISFYILCNLLNSKKRQLAC